MLDDCPTLRPYGAPAPRSAKLVSPRLVNRPKAVRDSLLGLLSLPFGEEKKIRYKSSEEREMKVVRSVIRRVQGWEKGCGGGHVMGLKGKGGGERRRGSDGVWPALVRWICLGRSWREEEIPSLLADVGLRERGAMLCGVKSLDPLSTKGRK